MLIHPFDFNLLIGIDNGDKESHTVYYRDILKNNQDYETFKLYMDFVKEVVGKIKWKNTVRKSLIKDFVTVSDEALALLDIDNSEYVWEAQSLKQESVPLIKSIHHLGVREGYMMDGQLRDGRNLMSILIWLKKTGE